MSIRENLYYSLYANEMFENVHNYQIWHAPRGSLYSTLDRSIGTHVTPWHMFHHDTCYITVHMLHHDTCKDHDTCDITRYVTPRQHVTSWHMLHHDTCYIMTAMVISWHMLHHDTCYSLRHSDLDPTSHNFLFNGYSYPPFSISNFTTQTHASWGSSQ